MTRNSYVPFAISLPITIIGRRMLRMPSYTWGSNHIFSEHINEMDSNLQQILNLRTLFCTRNLILAALNKLLLLIMLSLSQSTDFQTELKLVRKFKMMNETCNQN